MLFSTPCWHCCIHHNVTATTNYKIRKCKHYRATAKLTASANSKFGMPQWASAYRFNFICIRLLCCTWKAKNCQNVAIRPSFLFTFWALLCPSPFTDKYVTSCHVMSLLLVNCVMGCDCFILQCCWSGQNVTEISRPSLRLHAKFHLNLFIVSPSREENLTFSALTLLVGHQEGHPACKKTEWWDVGVVVCMGCRLAYSPADATATHYLLLQ